MQNNLMAMFGISKPQNKKLMRNVYTFPFTDILIEMQLI